MMGFAGLEFTSASGKKFQCTPIARDFQRSDAAEVLRVFSLAVGPEGHRVRKIRRSHQARRNPALEIGGEQQRQLRFVLQSVQQLCRLVRLAAQKERPVHMNRHGERAHVILLHGIAQLQVLGTLHVEKASPAPDHEDLSDLLFHASSCAASSPPTYRRHAHCGSGWAADASPSPMQARLEWRQAG